MTSTSIPRAPFNRLLLTGAAGGLGVGLLALGGRRVSGAQVVADALAIGVGVLLGRHLPERVIAIGAAVLFFAFAAWLITDGLIGASVPVIAGTLSAVVIITGIGIVLIRRENRLRSDEGVRALVR